MSDYEKKIEDQAALYVDETYGGALWRNNNGAAMAVSKDGQGGVKTRQIRFGLGNDSSQLSKVYKSSDRIGGVPITITPEMVGKTVCILTAMEAKDHDWKYSDKDERAVGQLNFINHVRRMGGIGGFFQNVEHVAWHIQEYIKWLKS